MTTSLGFLQATAKGKLFICMSFLDVNEDIKKRLLKVT